MLQIVQHQKTGILSVERVPKPALKGAGVVVRNAFSVISVGTEKTSVETAQASMIGKARMRPDLVRQVVLAAKREGMLATYNKVRSRLDAYKDLGYSSAGTVVESSVESFRAGDRVACGGGGFASHAEMIFVPVNLVSRIPKNVTFEEAAFTTLGAIAMQGVRQANVRIGENVAVIGLGLIGLVTVQILKANGCRVIGIDIRPETFALARKLGCDECIPSDREALRKISSFTGGFGTDAVLITAATKSNAPLELAIEAARKKSSVVVVGAVRMDVPRSPFYEKELDLKISCSYGPGRYDPNYEEQGVDYPVGYVRWTENRNMNAVLDLMAQRRLDVRSLITHSFPIRDAANAYGLILGKRKEPFLGVLISYDPPVESSTATTIELRPDSTTLQPPSDVVAGVIGAGNFAQSYLLPHFRRSRIQTRTVVVNRPSNALSVGKKFGFDRCSSNPDDIMHDPAINAVFIATRHDSHATLVMSSMQNGKHVFVEKPLAVTEKELRDIQRLYASLNVNGKKHLTVGFNRRYSEPMRDMKEFVSSSGAPVVVNYRVNAGFVQSSHWIHDRKQGGRIVGEACHFIDSMTFLAGSPPKTVFARALDPQNHEDQDPDTVSVLVTFENGSLGSLLYLANGAPSVPKEYCEVFCGGRTAVMQNFERVIFSSEGKTETKKYDGGKGHAEEVADFADVVKGLRKPSLSFDSICTTTRATFKILESLRKGTAVDVS